MVTLMLITRSRVGPCRVVNSLLDRGTFVLSLDTELAWGSAHTGSLAKREPLFQLTRTCIDRLLQLLERYQIKATWAIVGHLFLGQCQPVNGVKHPEIVRPAYPWFKDDWFAADPCTEMKDAPVWYGKDIIQQILSCKVSQEIGCHTFSHVQVGDPGCSRECFESELRACRLAAEQFGVTLRSFVFPRNMVGHLDVLRECGFVSYRGEDSPELRRLPRLLRRLLYHFRMEPSAVPAQRMGLWNLPGSLFYPPPLSWGGSPAVALQVWKAKRSLHRAARERRLFHLWFHPFNLAINPERLLGGLESIFAEFCRYREKGLLDNLPMGELAHTLSLER